MAGLEPPRDFRTLDISGNVVTLGWAPANGVPPAGYVIEGGLTPGAVLGSLTTPGTATTFTFTAPSGVFYLRVRALVGQTRSGASNEIQISVNVPGLPSAPTDLLGLADGSDLTLAWRNTLRGGTATGVELDVSGAKSGSFPLPLTER